MKKRLIAAGLMLVLLSTLLSMGAWADDSALSGSLTVEAGKLTAGKTVTVNVALDDVGGGYNSLAMTITYDPAVLAYDSAALGSAAANAGVTVLRTGEDDAPGAEDKAVAVLNTGTSGTLIFEYASGSNLTAEGTVLTLTFTVADATTATTVSAAVTSLLRVTTDNIDGEDLTGTATMTVYIPGDINGDGKVSNKDVTRLIKYRKGKDVTVVKAALDVNGDETVNNKDVTRLIKYLKGKDVAIY